MDLIGLSGLITPSLDEMVHVAREMEREGFRVPAADRRRDHQPRAHRASRSRRPISQPVVHVVDASRAVGVVAAAQEPRAAHAFADENRREQERAREQHSGPRVAPSALARGSAPHNAASSTGATTSRPCRRFTGARIWECVPLDELVPLIDWTPFFHAWELKGVYPRIFEDAMVGPRAKELFDDARKLLARNRRGKIAHRARRGRLLPRQ